MQRCAAAWVPDFVFTESTFQPLVPGPGGGVNAKQLAAALAATGGDRQHLASVVALLIDRSAPVKLTVAIAASPMTVAAFAEVPRLRYTHCRYCRLLSRSADANMQTQPHMQR